MICLGLLSIHILPLRDTASRAMHCCAGFAACADYICAIQTAPTRSTASCLDVATGWKILGNGVKAAPCRAMAFVLNSSPYYTVVNTIHCVR